MGKRQVSFFGLYNSYSFLYNQFARVFKATGRKWEPATPSPSLCDFTSLRLPGMPIIYIFGLSFKNCAVSNRTTTLGT